MKQDNPPAEVTGHLTEKIRATAIESIDSSTAIIRIGHTRYIARWKIDSEGFSKDQFASLHFNSGNVPIPKVELIDKTTHYTICISELARGRPMSTMLSGEYSKNTPFYEYRAVLSTLIESVHDTNISSFRGYGEFDASGHAPWNTWHDFLDSTAKTIHEITPGLDSAIKQSLSAALELYESVIHYCPEDRYLVHGDLWNGNILLEDGDVTGLIDWEAAAFGDKLYDATIFLTDTNLHPVSEYYQKRMSEYTHFLERVTCYQLHSLLKEFLNYYKSADYRKMRSISAMLDSTVIRFVG